MGGTSGWIVRCLLILAMGICALPISCMFVLERDESLYGAAQQGDVATMKRWIAAGADVNARFDGATPVLVAAVGSGKYAAVEFLLQRGADVRAVDEIDKPTLREAYKNEPRLKSLLAKYGYRR
jgi:ankyrin repeat protein